jgi:hypothetical protein
MGPVARQVDDHQAIQSILSCAYITTIIVIFINFYKSKGSVPEAFYTSISTVLSVSPVLCDYRASCI